VNEPPPAVGLYHTVVPLPGQYAFVPPVTESVGAAGGVPSIWSVSVWTALVLPTLSVATHSTVASEESWKVAGAVVVVAVGLVVGLVPSVV
jgi:hypothetical protein